MNYVRQQYIKFVTPHFTQRYRIKSQSHTLFSSSVASEREKVTESSISYALMTALSGGVT